MAQVAGQLRGGDEYHTSDFYFILGRNKLWIQAVSGHAGGAACGVNRRIKDAESHK